MVFLAGTATGGGALSAARAPRALERLPTLSGTVTYRDSRLPHALPERSWHVFYPRNPSRPPGPERDPKFNQGYPFRLYVQCREDAGGADLASVPFVIHYLRREDAPLARRVGGVLGRLYWIARDYLGRGPAHGRAADVWLTRTGDPGGEEFEGHLYLFSVQEPRAPAEWVREIAHEYAHLTLPELGPFREPEKWASGYLGERLYLKWLLYDNQPGELWDKPIDGAAYVQRQVMPLRARYLDAGPAAGAGSRRDAAGMDYFIGQMLAVEATWGPAVLRRLLDSYKHPAPEDLPAHLARALRETHPLVVDPLAYVPGRTSVAGDGSARRFKRATYWLLIPGGDWEIRASGELPQGTTAVLAGASLRPATTGAWETSLPGIAASWRQLQLTAPGGGTFTLEKLELWRSKK